MTPAEMLSSIPDEFSFPTLYLLPFPTLYLLSSIHLAEERAVAVV
jgi:hypothetical protein